MSTKWSVEMVACAVLSAWGSGFRGTSTEAVDESMDREMGSVAHCAFCCMVDYSERRSKMKYKY